MLNTLSPSRLFKPYLRPFRRPLQAFPSSSRTVNMDQLRNHLRMSSLSPHSRKHKVTIVGSGNWGSTIAKVVAENTRDHPELFEKNVQMWVYEEDVTLDEKSPHFKDAEKGPQKLTTLINKYHENVKYLPGIKLPENVIANPSIVDSVKDSSILVFNLPHQFILNLCKQLRGNILPYARGISCIKGVNVEESSISLFSETIGKELDIYCGALSGANIASEVAQEKFSETTIAYAPPPMDSRSGTPVNGQSPSSSHVDLTKLAGRDASGKKTKANLKPMPEEYPPLDQHTMKTLFHRRYFQIRVVSDVAGVSLGGALKNIIAVAAGWVDGLGWGDNAKAAIMRIGLMEMVHFGNEFFPKTINNATFLEESAGVADLITTCNGGRNWRCAKMSIQEGKPIEEIEERELNGQKLQGAQTAVEVNKFLKSKDREDAFPLFTAVYNILQGKAKAEDLPTLIEGRDESNRDHESTSTIPPDANLPYAADSDPDPPQAVTKNATLVSHHVPTATSSSANQTDSGADPDLATQPTNHTNPKPTNKYPFLHPSPSLTTSRYSRPILIPSFSLPGQLRLSRCKVLIIGLGGLGSPCALYLAGAGVHTLGLLDDDVVELSNLHRQIIHSEESVRRGMGKVQSALERCRELNSEVHYRVYRERLTVENAMRIIEEGGYDVVCDCTDNPATRYLISDVCVVLGKVLVSGAAQGVEGQLMVLNSPPRAKRRRVEIGEGNVGVGGDREEIVVEREKGPCYRCVFPRPPAPEMVKGCGEVGILGPVVGTIGTMMAGEAIRIVARGGLEEEEKASKDDRVVSRREEGKQKHSILLYSPWSEDPKTVFRTIGLRGRRKDCLACGDEDMLREKGSERITVESLREGRMDYQAFCGVVEDVKILSENERVGVGEFLDVMGRSGSLVNGWSGQSDIGEKSTSVKSTAIVVDVREPNEVLLGPKIDGSINIPISKILRTGFASDLTERDSVDERPDGDQDTRLSMLDGSGPVYFLCQQGNDSQIAARRFQESMQSTDNVGDVRWIGDVKGGFNELERIMQKQ